MPRKQRSIHYIYKTTNLINNKYYLGMHSAHTIDDGYLGSGTKLRRSIRKYGAENFKREILEFCESKKDLIKKESEIITKKTLEDPLCMNLKVGGEGGDTFSHKTEEEKELFRKSQAEKQKKWISNNLETFREVNKKTSKVMKEKFAKGLIKKSFLNKKHTQEAKDKIGKNSSLKQKAELNSQYGTLWITNGIVNKKIKKDIQIPDKWYKGRKNIFLGNSVG